MSGSGPAAGETTHRLAFLKSPPTRPTSARPVVLPDDEPSDDGEGACAAFGYLWGTKDRALAVEFRFADGNAETLPCSHLAGWRFDPSVGVLLRFTADVVTLVLVRGGNLDVPAAPGGVDLLAGGFQRHRVT